jgi:hypothetical protein
MTKKLALIAPAIIIKHGIAAFVVGAGCRAEVR